jgi:hypothetical protein
MFGPETQGGVASEEIGQNEISSLRRELKEQK